VAQLEGGEGRKESHRSTLTVIYPSAEASVELRYHVSTRVSESTLKADPETSECTINRTANGLDDLPRRRCVEPGQHD
jgi:hypothetical protein